MFRFYRKHKKYYKQNINLAVPVIISQVGQVSVQLADSIFVGHLPGSVPLAAVSFGAAVYFLMYLFGDGISLGLTPLVGEKYAQGNFRQSAIYFQNALVLFAVMGVAIYGLQLAIVPLMSHFGQDPEVVAMAIPFYKYLALSMIPFMIFAAFKQFLEGLGNTKVSMWIVITANVVNIILNYTFIFGKFGFPAMGVTGSGLATFIARMLMPIMIAVYFFRKDSLRRYFGFFSRLNFSIRNILELLKVGLPISIQMFIEGGIFSLTTIMVGWMGAVALAANQIALSIISTSFSLMIGIVAATTILVSHAVGRGSRRDVQRIATSSYHLGIVYSLTIAVLFLSLRKFIPMAYTDDPQVMTIASTLLIVAAIFQFMDCMQFISIGILRGLKDVRYTMGVAFVAYLLINLPMAYIMAFVLDLGPAGVWSGYIFGLGTAAILLNRRYRKLIRRAKLSNV